MPPPSPRTRGSGEGREKRAARDRTASQAFAYVLVAPALILMAAVIAYPLALAGFQSLTTSSFINPEPEFVGLRNYVRILRSAEFRRVFWNSTVWTTAVIGFQFLLGLATALVLNRRFRGRGLARALIIIPWVIPGVIAAMLWRLMYDPQLGIINGVLALTGFSRPTIPWLAQPATAMPAVILSAIWKGTPFSTVMYLAALQGVSDELLDAADVDGASGWAKLRYVVIPEIMPTIRVTVLLTAIWTFNYFDLIWVMTRGGPVSSTHIFPTFIYELAFVTVRTGTAAAYGLIATVILLVVSLAYVRELRRAEVV